MPTNRLNSLTVTAGGTNVLSGFSSTNYSYAATIDGASATIAASAVNSSATVRIGRGIASTGSATRQILVSQGSTSSQDVVVTSGTQNCTYSLSVTRTSGPATDCPAWSGLQLVGGVCIEACPAPLLPIFDSDGEVTGCQSVGDCPWDLMGFDPADLQY